MGLRAERRVFRRRCDPSTRSARDRVLPRRLRRGMRLAAAPRAGAARSPPRSQRGGAASYQPRSMEGTVLHRVVREHFETVRAEIALRTEGGGLPQFVEREFPGFLTCGALSRGFARVRCDGCAFERLVPFSCKRRGFCPSCGGRRLAELAPHLVDAVLPAVPVRQWVLTLPHRLRYLLAYNHALCRAGRHHERFGPRPRGARAARGGSCPPARP